ncbi:MAG: DNA-processing protein DprA [Lachnospiraceae bacterium]|nr:DNA-processing protein DprA [Lachnospiraceae bacterium]
MDDIRYITGFEKEFPEKLKEIQNPPAGIYVRGCLPDESKKSVAIVGSRQCSMYGAKVAEYFGSELAANGVQIISGMACGVDGISQKAALSAGGSTFAVLGSGPDVIYPKCNESLYEEILNEGGIISEQPPGTAPLPAYFAQRNRIIAALCDVLLVIEARIRSGTGITVRYALDQGKDVFAVPGRINDPMSAGTNRLISEGALIALNPDCILRDLFGSDASAENTSGNESKEKKIPRRAGIAGKEKVIYDLLDMYPKKTDELMSLSGLTLQDVHDALLKLRLCGLAQECGKNNYVRKKL